MANPWFRVYTEMVDDEKLRLLAFEDRWHYVAILCCKGKGMLDSGDDHPMVMRKLSVKLGLTVRETETVLMRLHEVGLVDADTAIPTGWDDRQFISDSSTERVKAYREKMKRKGNVSVTVQDTDTDTDTEKKKPKADASPKGSRLPEDWSPPEMWLEWARFEKPGINPLQEADKFRDYWHGVAGAKARKANWLSTWRNWIRNANVQPANRNNTGYTHAQPKLTPAERTAVSIALNNGGEIPDGYENNGGVVAEVERNLRSQVDLRLRDGRNGVGCAHLGQGIKWLNGGASG